ncbi:iron hydrogenase [Infundibulicybe gibba]|nr:iron hydrogenase [Infundibulicybe gibba]
MAFSGALTLTDLNDFITPSQACIKPVEQLNPQPKIDAKDAGAASTHIQIDETGAYYEGTNGVALNQEKVKLERAQISLNDCLACSGCITSAESVLITLQSHTEVLDFLTRNAALPASERKIPVVSIAPQSLASLATAYGSPPSGASGDKIGNTNGNRDETTLREMLNRVRAFWGEMLGVEKVFDTTFARHLALQEHVREFEERRRARMSVNGAGVRESGLPMLASACPGWICYAEKAHAEMLPFIAQTKSPQQTMGTLVKTWMGKLWDRRPDEIYHVTVMPCYDKKLEASRTDFYNAVYQTRDVDCVITTGELELMMREKGWNLDLAAGETTGLMNQDLPELIQHPGSSSGSYLQAIMAHVERSSSLPLVSTVKAIRSADYEEHVLAEADGGRVVFRGAKCFGFRNVQNVVRKVGRESGVRVGIGAAGKMAGRRAKRDGEGEKGYDYVEVMACPGGCINGGGQVKPTTRDAEGYKREWEQEGVQNARWGDKEWTKQVERTYWTGAEGSCGDASIDELALKITRDCGSESFRTTYRAVESDVVGLAVKW